MSNQYKINPQFIFRQDPQKGYCAISLEDGDNRYFVFKDAVEFVIKKIVEGKSENEILGEIKNLQNDKTEIEIQNFYKKLIDDLLKLQILTT